MFVESIESILINIDACSVIGNNKHGLIGLYYEMTDQRRRLNPYVAGPNGRGSSDLQYINIFNVVYIL